MSVFKKGDQSGNQPGSEQKQTPKNGPQMPFMGGSKQPFWVNLLTTLFVFLLLVAGYSYFLERQDGPETIPLSELVSDIKAGEVSEVIVEGNDLTAEYAEGPNKLSRKESGAAFSQTLVNYGVSAETIDAVDIQVKEEGGFGYWAMTLGPFLIPIVFLVVFLWFLSRQVRGQGMQALSFGQSKARMISPDDKAQQIKFKDIAGAKEAKEELSEIVDFLRNPKKFLKIGAKIPKGVLLMGAPGTGKTLLARGVAGEAGVTFFSISGSEFVEMFVGVGASRVRDLFKMAKQSAPAIIFIDEIDAIGRVRGSGMGGGNDEREQTLNQILVEMDGFEPNEKIIMISATNRPDVLDPALLRPGRFDRRVTIDLPDKNDRKAILEIHAAKKPLAEDADLEVIAQRTPGFSGADLYSLMNEAAILAARENRQKLSQYDMIRSIEKVLLGPERRSHILSPYEKKVTAYHEAGHALVASVLPHTDPVHKISVISRGRAAGFTLKLPFEDKRLHSKNQFLDDIAMSLGGYVAEKLIIGDITTGAANDLQVLTATARSMVTRYGMSDKLGPVAFESDTDKPAYGLEGGKEYSPEVNAKIDAEVSRIINEAYEKAEHILTEHRQALEVITKRLMEAETIERQEFEEILVAHGITPKQPQDEAAGQETQGQI